MGKVICSVEICDKPVRCRGFCNGHYARWLKTGDPGTTPLKRYDPGRGCSVEGCERPHKYGGMCDMHAARQKLGIPLNRPPLIFGDDARRFESYCQPGTVPECLPWLGPCIDWLGSRDRKGYGRFSAEGAPVLAHRYVYESRLGPIPNDLTLDHLCMNTRCVNVWHLQVLSLGENIRRENQRRE